MLFFLSFSVRHILLSFYTIAVLATLLTRYWTLLRFNLFLNLSMIALKTFSKKKNFNNLQHFIFLFASFYLRLIRRKITRGHKFLNQRDIWQIVRMFKLCKVSRVVGVVNLGTVIFNGIYSLLYFFFFFDGPFWNLRQNWFFNGDRRTQA